jgi:hypothetical protein
MHPSFDEPWKEFNGELPITATVRKFTRGKLEGSELSHAVMRPDQFADNRQAEVAAGRPRRAKEREERGLSLALVGSFGRSSNTASIRREWARFTFFFGECRA